jgi:hypothetical protein
MHLCRFLLFAVGTDDRNCYIRLLHELQRRSPEAQACERGGKRALQALLLLAATSNALAVGHGVDGISNPAARRFQIPPSPSYYKRVCALFATRDNTHIPAA